MAPLPAMRCSPGKERMIENNHKRGRSFESGLSFKSKDDDLMLFNEMQNQEKDNFLLHTVDDFEESISKLKHFSDFKLGVQTRGEGSDLLNVEGDKNDYDWLLTPPDTPLFPSLDDEYPQPINLESRGRARSEPITISRSVADKSCPASRTSSSPCRLSSSPRSGGHFTQMRGRSSPVPRSSSPPVIRSTTPTRRTSTPNKQSAPTMRSSAPTLQKNSAGCSTQSSKYGARGPSPMKASRGNSASSTLQGWQMTIPGFALDTPPNLRTSLLDRPVSHARGSSPASLNGRESAGRLGRKSMSPTSSRSISSSHSQERDRLSSYSRCSILSSGDDDEESVHPLRAGVSSRFPARKDGVWASNNAMPFSRKPTRCSPTNSTPKRSFDSALRLMDQRKTPQNMFRPLLSSVPATTFRPIFSRNSSLTTSSNASSEQALFSVALDVEGGELEQTEIPAGWERSEASENHEEVFLFDKMDEIIEDTSHEVLSNKPEKCDANFGENLSKKFDSEDVHNPSVHIGIETNNTFHYTQHFTDNRCDMDGLIMSAVCSKCGKECKTLDMNGNIKLCHDCAEERLCVTEVPLTFASSIKNVAISMDTAMGTACNELQRHEVSEFHEVGDIMESNWLPNICSIQRESELSEQQDKRDINATQDCSINVLQLSDHDVNPSLKVDIPEGTGISVLLLPRSGSSKWPILQGKSVSATNIQCSEPSYSRGNINCLRRSIGRVCTSASSSVDLGSSRQAHTSVLHQLCREGEADTMVNCIDRNAQSMSLSDELSMSCYESRHLKSECEETTSSSTEFLRCDSARELKSVTEEHAISLGQSSINAIPSSPSRPVNSENYLSDRTGSYMTVCPSDPQIMNQRNIDISCSSTSEILGTEVCTSSIHTDGCSQNNEGKIQNVEGSRDISCCSEMEENYTMLNCSPNHNLDVATNNPSNVTFQFPCGCSELEGSQTECTPSHNPAYLEESDSHFISQTSENDACFSTTEPSTVILDHGNHEDSGVIIELPRGRMSRSLTLDEATDTILFCSSIVHDLAYKAATIAMERASNLLSEPRQASHPTFTNLGKPIPELRESWKVPINNNKHTTRSQKFRRKRLESQTKSSPQKEVENDVNVHEFIDSNSELPRKLDTAKPLKLESKCNCTVM